MTRTHTPGPWHPRPIDGGDQLVMTGDGLIVARVKDHIELSHQLNSNAALIAAAPDLLTELHAADIIIRQFEEFLRERHLLGEVSFSRRKSARETAITKAEGREAQV